MNTQQYTERLKEHKLRHYSSSIQALKDLTDLGHADDSMAKDYAGRFAFELMQNGADAYQKASARNSDLFPPCKGRVCFALTRNCLIVANTGTPFSSEPDPEDRADISSIESISRLGESTKQSGQYIGNKGIGFRSIYQICDRLWLISGGHQILYDGRRTWDEIRNRLQSNTSAQSSECITYLERYRMRIPMLKVGFWAEFDDLPGEASGAVKNLREQGYDTILVLERTGDTHLVKVDETFIWDRLASLNEKEILFLDTLGEVQCNNIDEPAKSFSFHMEREGDRRIIRRSPDQAEWSFLVFSYPIPDIEKSAQIAFLLNDEGKPEPAALSDRVFYSFYPAARETHGFPFFIHSYFMLNPNREYFNCEDSESIERNRVLLENLSVHLVKDAVPALRRDFPDVFLPGLLLPQVSGLDKERLSDTDEFNNPTTELLSRQGGLSTWFIRDTLARLSKEGVIRNISGDYTSLREVKSVDDKSTARAADALLRRLADTGNGRGYQRGLTYYNELLLDATSDVKEIFESASLSLEDLASALETAGPELTLDEYESASMILLLSQLSGDDNKPLRKAIEIIRAAKGQVLPCLGTDDYQPLPEYPEQGKPMLASATSPLVFYLPSAAEVELDETEEAELQKPPSVTSQSIPPFCHVHVLKEEVLNSIPDVDPDRMRTILREQFGLRPFRPEDVFVRIAESTLHESAEGQALTDEQHRELLEASIRLIERRRLRRVAREPLYDFKPWYLKDRSDSDWRLYYFLARSFIPLNNTWERGSRLILAGRLSSHGEEIRPAYGGTNQVFLTEKNEAAWFVEHLNKYHSEYADYSESKGLDIEEEELRFRRYVYLLLGAWDGLRVDIVHHPEGIRSPATDPSINPHDFISDEEWNLYISESKCPWAFDLLKCHLIQSAAIPHLEELTRDIDVRARTISGLQHLLNAIRKYVEVEVRTRSNTQGCMHSFLYRQLKNFPWVDNSLRDPAIPAGSRVWFTRQNISHVTHSRQSAHYLCSVTARQISESLANAVEMPVLEEAKKSQLGDFIELYRHLCNRLETKPSPGPGFLTLYRTVVSRIQQILVGAERFDDDKLEAVKEDEEGALEALREAGVIVFEGKGHEIRLKRDIRRLYYDDTGIQNPVFRTLLTMAALDDTSQGFARLLGINLLSKAEVEYTDETDSRFAGNETIEQEAREILDELQAPLFAFRAFSTFMPEAQRLIVGEETYNQRWETFRSLKVEVVPLLRISIDGNPLKAIPNEFPVVLEHESQNKKTQRLFVRKTCLTSDNRIPLRLLARPLAAVLGAEAQTIAVEMLIQQYEKDGLEAVYAYLFEQCEVTPEQIRSIENLDDVVAAERAKQIFELEDRLFRAIEAISPSCIVSEKARKDLHSIISEAQSLTSVPLLAYLQNNLGIPLNLVASDLELKPFRANVDSFIARKEAFRQQSLLAAASVLEIREPSDKWSDIVASYDNLCLPAETRFLLEPEEEEILQPIVSWLREYSSYLHSEITRTLTENEQDLWNSLFPTSSDVDPQRNIGILNVFAPYVLALCQKTSGHKLSELLEAMDEYGLQNLSEQSAQIEDIRSQLEGFLNRYRVSHDAIELLFKDWPMPGDVYHLGLDVHEIDKLRFEMERHKSKQLSRTKKQVMSYRRYLEELVQESTLQSDPIEVSFRTVEVPTQPVLVNQQAQPRRVKKQPVTEEQFLAVDFRKRVIGECAESYVLEVQRMRWGQLAHEAPGLSYAHLAELQKYYDSEEDAGDDDSPGNAFRHLGSVNPEEWTNDQNWPMLRRLLYMAEWSPSAGYDVLGLDCSGDGKDPRVFRIEVKATGGKRKLDFPISRNELEEAARNGETYVIWRAVNIAYGSVPRFFRLENPMKLINEGRIQTADQVTILKPLLNKLD